MNHAKEHHIGDIQPDKAKKTTRIASATQRVYELDAKTQRCGRNSERQTKSGAYSDASNGFLRTSFLPKLQQTKTIKACAKSGEIEHDFYKSLSLLAEHYNVLPMPTKAFGYPYNMALAISDIGQKVNQRILDCPEIRLVQDSGKIYFISEEKYNTGTTLYYIPVEPLYQMLHDPKRRKNAQLLVSVCAYLYHIVQIPYYRQENSYLYWMYEMHKEWEEQDDETQDNERDLLEFAKAELIGDCIEKKIFNRMNLVFFEKRLQSFKRSNAFNEDCYQIANKAFVLYHQYPNETVFRNATKNNEPQCEQDQDQNEMVAMQKYISFIARTKGSLYENMEQSINNEFNEYAQMDEPTIIKTFDGTDAARCSLDFENRLFDLLDNLCHLLYNCETSTI